jgi:hypothetical protein
MAKRAIRIVKHYSAVPSIAVCTYCSHQFTIPSTALLGVMDATDNLQEQFEAHKCKLVDSSQNALRIVRAATENK